jgi:hypothetical protein
MLLMHAWYWYHTKQLHLKNIVVAVVVCVLLMLPWSLQLSAKYGGFNFMGNSGKLNMSWYLMSCKEYKDEIKVLIPPTYNDSPSFWEDPSASQAPLHSPFESAQTLFLRWPARIVHTCMVAVQCCSEISFALLGGLLISALVYLRKQKHQQLNFVLLAALCTPLGYLAMHIETRYIWLTGLCGIIVIARLLEDYLQQKYRTMVISVFALSLLLYPIYHMQKLYDTGKRNFELSTQMLNKNIKHAKFMSNVRDAGGMWAAAYLSGNQYYTIDNFNFTAQELSAEILRYGIQYYVEDKAFTTAGFELALPNVTAQLVAESADHKIYQLRY